MENSILNRLPFDPVWLILGCCLVCAVLIVLTLVSIFRVRNLYRRYDRFIRGRDAESLEETILAMSEELRNYQKAEQSHQNELMQINHMVKHAFVKFGVVKYDGFKGMGGQASFVLTMLDKDDNGIIINSLHARDNCYLYLKEVNQGSSPQALSNEEKECLTKAMGGKRF